ncbi:hypothetical protein WOLCODRAFT_103090 [Wolfiporia cocos MD-104 SS10]|uniref:BTB domain-containing protein n=1 Tax=Wolfiporia cocos (strain MD-104) TaxID=742152 RepID=A0A2H3JYZ9_WOLCO|nr:hypothetical protein WOLCODRAFT_103090 [Wolfiporia cocos MD-104 SS10]
MSDNTEGPRRKRPREETSPPALSAQTQHSDSEGLTRDTSFWFPDGNIVLVAQEDAFRVHQSVLSRGSTFFREMFGVPQPLDSEKLDGSYVIRLADRSDDVRCLLRVLYDGGSMLLGPDTEVEFSTIAAVVRLGHKYELDDLKFAALGRLERCFPTEYVNWDFTSNRAKSCGVVIKPADAIVAVNLARLTNTLSILPVALYQCCWLSTEDLLQGGMDSIDKLSTDDLRRCINAKALIALSTSGIIATISRKRPYTCSCEAVVRRVVEHLANDHEACLDPSQVQWPNRSIKYIERHCCPACRAEVQSKRMQQAKITWSRLPKLMDLNAPAWKDELAQIPVPS